MAASPVDVGPGRTRACPSITEGEQARPAVAETEGAQA
jgi:hypothetical protein